ncbi:uncharacterized protein VP01_592g1 [Puccinia sorghi]|uniref:Uncharacterized protein n=1 Tax=Puccinia sorghi TaxID=27349 RepID=A0A0L6UJT0_9BASI|nr:uncharacterized protein VP01_592g1 [Puccinia sorghi]
MAALRINLFQCDCESLNCTVDENNNTQETTNQVEHGNLHILPPFLGWCKCDGEFTSAGPLIWDGIKTGTPPIDWSVYLLQSPSRPEFNKPSNYLLCDVALFDEWVDLATSLGKDNVDCVLKLQMEDHDTLEKQESATVEHLPVYIDPGHPNQYILLTVGVIQAWAQALVSPASSAH